VRFVLWTDDPDLAAAAARAGVSRIGPDLEILGKQARQPGGADRISHHRRSTLADLRLAIGEAWLHVRTDPVHPGYRRELEGLLEAGVRSVMLPMVRGVDSVRRVVSMIGGRAELIVMIEQADALSVVEELAGLEGVDALYVGVNDLSRSLRLPTRFSLLVRDEVEVVAAAAHRHGRGFGFFGIARVGETGLPIPPDLIYAEQVRLGANVFILARSFRATPDGIGAELARARARLSEWRESPAQAREAASLELRRRCDRLAAGIAVPAPGDR